MYTALNAHDVQANGCFTKMIRSYIRINMSILQNRGIESLEMRTCIFARSSPWVPTRRACLSGLLSTCSEAKCLRTNIQNVLLSLRRKASWACCIQTDTYTHQGRAKQPCMKRAAHMSMPSCTVHSAAELSQIQQRDCDVNSRPDCSGVASSSSAAVWFRVCAAPKGGCRGSCGVVALPAVEEGCGRS
jgi:hypothetical protein